MTNFYAAVFSPLRAWGCFCRCCRKSDSAGRLSHRRSVQWQGLENVNRAARVEIAVALIRASVFNLFIKKLARPRCWKNIFVLLRIMGSIKEARK